MSEYDETLGILRDALSFGIKPSLDGIKALTEVLGNPQLAYPAIQVAGTNGKSSTARFAAGILRALGLKVGLYTSPELVYYEERIEVDQQVISRDDFAAAVKTAHTAAVQLVENGTIPCITEFELLTAAAFLHFAHRQIDVAVLEVGLGGRWDATSVVDPKVAVITGIGLDHIAILGSTLEEIAGEKAAIIKPGSIAVLGPGTASTIEVFKRRIAETAARVHKIPIELPEPVSDLFDEMRLPSYQPANFACAIAAAEAFLGRSIEPEILKQAILATPLPGRFESLRKSPFLIIDAAHNPQSAQALAATLRQRFGESVPATLLVGVLADKDADGIIDALSPLFARIAVTQTTSPRAVPAQDLAQRVRSRFSGEVLCYDTVKEAV
ncbi:MAG: Mur ligase family protein, partial [Coriobacteriia bacterium]|nr:Mur ligase family protein [Coriobacteriia bacterium]